MNTLLLMLAGSFSSSNIEFQLSLVLYLRNFIYRLQQPCETWDLPMWINVISLSVVVFCSSVLALLYTYAFIFGPENPPGENAGTSEEPAFDQTPGKPVKRWKVEIRLIEEEVADTNAVETVEATEAAAADESAAPPVKKG